MHATPATHHPDARRASRASTLIEALILAATVALLITLILPALGLTRTEARLAASRDNLATLGKANASYAALKSGFISGYDWDEDDGTPIDSPFPIGFAEFSIGADATFVGQNRLEFAQIQQAAILRRATGRFTHPGKIWPNLDRLPHRRFLHLPLTDWLSGSVQDPTAVSPLDTHLQSFRENPLEYDLLPGGDPDTAAGASWTNVQVVNRWPFASSYQSTVYAWSPSRPGPNGALAIAPARDDNSGLLMAINDPDAITPQPMADVNFPANKAHFFEEFDYTDGLGVNGRYHADPDATVNVLFFDGSARAIATADANPGWNASDPCDTQRAARLDYQPIDTRYFPARNTNVDDYPGPFRWTRGGLEGIDVGGTEINTTYWCE